MYANTVKLCYFKPILYEFFCVIHRPMNKPQIKLATTLTFFGAVPFIASMLGLVLGYDAMHVRYFSLSYGAVIISFLSGMHWGIFITQAQAIRMNLLVTSNVFALLAWASLLLVVPTLQYGLQILCFVVLFMIDRALTSRGILERWFYLLRQRITVVVIVCLIGMIALQSFSV